MSTSTTSINYSSGTASGLVEPTGTADVTSLDIDNNIQDLFIGIIQLAVLMMDTQNA
jgi:hypothetical protein